MLERSHAVSADDELPVAVAKIARQDFALFHDFVARKVKITGTSNYLIKE